MAQALFDVPRAALLPFFDAVPELYAKSAARTHEAYQRLLYTVEHQFTGDDLDAIGDAFGIPRPKWPTGMKDEAIRLLDGMRYPETMPIGRLTSVSGLDLRLLSHYLHFFHHAYPIYDKPSVAALNSLGYTVPRTMVRDPDAYGLYVAAVEDLKERIPFWCVPETNVHLNRIIQGALSEWT